MNYPSELWGPLLWPNQPINQYVHSCPKLAILIKPSTNNPSRKSVFLESSKPCLGCQFGSPGFVWQKTQESLTQDANWLRVLLIPIWLFFWLEKKYMWYDVMFHLQVLMKAYNYCWMYKSMSIWLDQMKGQVWRSYYMTQLRCHWWRI